MVELTRHQLLCGALVLDGVQLHAGVEGIVGAGELIDHLEQEGFRLPGIALVLIDFGNGAVSADRAQIVAVGNIRMATVVADEAGEDGDRLLVFLTLKLVAPREDQGPRCLDRRRELAIDFIEQPGCFDVAHAVDRALCLLCQLIDRIRFSLQSCDTIHPVFAGSQREEGKQADKQGQDRFQGLV